MQNGRRANFSWPTLYNKTAITYSDLFLENIIRHYFKENSIFLRDLITVAFVLNGCVTWCLTRKEQRKSRVFEKSVMRKEFGPKSAGSNVG